MNKPFLAIIIVAVVIIGTIAGLYVYDPGTLGLSSNPQAFCESLNVSGSPSNVGTSASSAVTATSSTSLTFQNGVRAGDNTVLTLSER